METSPHQKLKQKWNIVVEHTDICTFILSDHMDDGSMYRTLIASLFLLLTIVVVIVVILHSLLYSYF